MADKFQKLSQDIYVGTGKNAVKIASVTLAFNPIAFDAAEMNQRVDEWTTDIGDLLAGELNDAEEQ